MCVGTSGEILYLHGSSALGYATAAYANLVQHHRNLQNESACNEAQFNVLEDILDILSVGKCEQRERRARRLIDKEKAS